MCGGKTGEMGFFSLVEAGKLVRDGGKLDGAKNRAIL